jgi:light-regulated signal transduction histidine kinase (bacteriophytochrome)
MTRLSDEQLEAALAECASEAIRIPGAIQPHGVLLAMSEPGLITCAHPEPLLVSHTLRTMCAAIAQLLSVQICALQTRDEQQHRAQKFRLIGELTHAHAASRARCAGRSARSPATTIKHEVGRQSR